MNTPEIVTYGPAEKRRVLREARESGELSYDKLDRLLLEACSGKTKMIGLLRSLDNVRIVDSTDPNDILAEGLDEPMEGSADETDFFRLYASHVRSVRRLTRSEEHMLARRLEFARERLRALLADIGLPDETLERAVERGLDCAALREEFGDDPRFQAVLQRLPCGTDDPLQQNVIDEYTRLRRHFVERNLYLVVGMAAAYRTYGLPMMDLIQEGNASLIRAVEKFDWRKDVRFQTYAAFWVRQAIERLITANRGIVRVPNYIQQKMRRLRREGKLPRNHKDVDVRDVSTFFDTTPQGAARLMETDRSWYSLDAPLGEDEDSFASTLAADEDESGMTAAERRALGQRLDEVMAQHLTEQERDIITMRFGLGGTPRRTLDQIGEQMSVSRERIRQMQVKALDKLAKRRLRDELGDFL